MCGAVLFLGRKSLFDRAVRRSGSSGVLEETFVVFRLYRLYDFDPESGRGSYYVLRGSLTHDASLHLEAVQFRARLAAGVATWSTSPVV